jgi:hypothetical protein
MNDVMYSTSHALQLQTEAFFCGILVSIAALKNLPLHPIQNQLLD